MNSLARNLIPIAMLVLAGFTIHLLARINLLESAARRPPRNPSTDLVEVVNRMATSVLRSEAADAERIKAKDTHEALELMEHHISYRLYEHIPALRRVLSVSIGISLEFLNEKTGITTDA